MDAHLLVRYLVSSTRKRTKFLAVVKDVGRIVEVKSTFCGQFDRHAIVNYSKGKGMSCEAAPLCTVKS